MISYRIAFNNALYNGEFAWSDILSDSEREHYERCITAIIHWTRAAASRYTAQDIVRLAVSYGYTESPLVAAIVWRLHAEVSRS